MKNDMGGGRMNRYRMMMNTLPVPEGQAERLEAAVLAAAPEERGRRPFHPWRRGRELALAAVLAAVLLVTASASETVDWSPVFLGIFGSSSQSVPGAEGVFQDVQAVSVCDDVTLTVRQSIGDRNNLFVLLDYQLPGDVNLEDAEALENLRVPMILVYKGREIAWEDVKALSSMEEVTRALGLDCVAGQMTRLQGFDLESRTLTILVECALGDWSPLARIPNASVTLVAGPPERAAMDDEGEDIPLANQLAVVSFRPSFDVKSVKGSAKTEDGTTCKAEVSPLSLSVRIKGKDLPDWPAEDTLSELKALVTLRFRDGTEVPVTDLERPGGSSHGGGSLTHHDDGRLSGTRTLNLVFGTLQNPSQVEAVLVGDVEIPVS
jgi:hypothetical protein